MYANESIGQDASRASAKLPNGQILAFENQPRERRVRRARKEGNNYSMTECAYRTRAEVARRLSGHRSNQLQCCAKCSLPADGDRPAHQRNSIGNQWNSPKTTALLIPSGLNSIGCRLFAASPTRSISSRETPLSSSASTLVEIKWYDYLNVARKTRGKQIRRQLNINKRRNLFTF